MKVDVIIARYNENLTWVNELNQDYNVLVYNKGGEMMGPVGKRSRVINLKNIGREAHTYIKHIIDNYDKLNDINIFTQGDPFPHTKSFIESISNITRSGWVSDTTYTCDENGAPNHPGLPIKSFSVMSNILIKNFTEIKFKAGAIFAVTKADIHSHDLVFYNNLYELLEIYDKKGVVVDETKMHSTPWIIERLWGMIFNFSL